MKRAMTILGTVLISSTVFASASSILGQYTNQSSLRFFGSADSCEELKGVYEPETDTKNGICVVRNDSTLNTVTIAENGNAQTTVQIEVIYGAIHTRSFSGVVTNMKNNTLLVQETELNDDGKIAQVTKDACTLKITITGQKATTEFGKNCDRDLSRASETVKK